MLDRWSFSRRLLPKAKRAEAYFERGGGPAVFAGREVASAVDRAGGWLSVAVVALVVAWLLWRRRARRAAP